MTQGVLRPSLQLACVHVLRARTYQRDETAQPDPVFFCARCAGVALAFDIGCYVGRSHYLATPKFPSAQVRGQTDVTQHLVILS
jgi:hypothetical protein